MELMRRGPQLPRKRGPLFPRPPSPEARGFYRPNSPYARIAKDFPTDRDCLTVASKIVAPAYHTALDVVSEKHKGRKYIRAVQPALTAAQKSRSTAHQLLRMVTMIMLRSYCVRPVHAGFR